MKAPFHFYGIKCEKCGTYNTKLIWLFVNFVLNNTYLLIKIDFRIICFRRRACRLCNYARTTSQFSCSLSHLSCTTAKILYWPSEMQCSARRVRYPNESKYQSKRNLFSYVWTLFLRIIKTQYAFWGGKVRRYKDLWQVVLCAKLIFSE